MPSNKKIRSCIDCGKFYSMDNMDTKCSKSSCPVKSQKINAYKMKFTSLFVCFICVLLFSNVLLYQFYKNNSDCAKELKSIKKDNEDLADNYIAYRDYVDSLDKEDIKLTIKLMDSIDCLNSKPIEKDTIYIEKKKINFSKCELDCLNSH